MRQCCCKRSLLGLVFFLWVGCVNADAGLASRDPSAALPESAPITGTQAVPVIEIPEATFDFGDGVCTGEVSHGFLIRNSGEAVLEIKKVTPG